MRGAPRSSIRIRLTLQFAALFFLAGAFLLTLNFALVRRSIDISPAALRQRIESRLGYRLPDVPAPPADSTTAQVISAAREELVAETLRQLMLQSLVALGVMTVVSSGLGWVVAGRVLQPITAMTERARRIGETNLHERIALDGPADELKELADTFDELLARLDAAFESQRRFAANASHELRTPLSIIRTEIDVTLKEPIPSAEELREMGEAIRSAALRSELLIDGLLALAQSDAGIRRWQPIELQRLVGEAIAAHETQRKAAGVRTRGRREHVVVSGDPTLLRALVNNLIDNAVRYNHSGGWVEVTVERSEGSAELRVVNSGPVIPDDRLESLFEPFTRMKPQRTASDRGAGLGLSIVRAVASAHAACLEVRAIETGGLDIRITFPRGRHT